MMDNIDLTLFQIALIIYISSWISQTTALIFTKRKLALTGTVLLAMGLAANVASLITRGLDIGHMPFTSLYETLSLFCILLTIALLIMARRIRIEQIGAFAMPVVILAMVVGLTRYTAGGELAPALRNFWLSIHVPIAILSYALFALAFIGGCLYLVRNRLNPCTSIMSRLPELETLDIFIYRFITAGFIFLTAGIMTGAVWANIAWGSYWSWDPKETWSLVTWLIYALYLHARLIGGWRGSRSAVIAVIGFTAVLFTYFGVTFLLSGLHTYA